MKRCLIYVLLAGMVWLPAQARLGETLSDIQKVYGRPEPQPRNNKRAATWLLEGEDGQIIYTVTFDEKGRSVGEGMKPVRYAKFSENTAHNFIAVQMGPYSDSKTIQKIQPGEKYSFGGKAYTAGDEERVLLDDANDILIIWSVGAMPSIMAVSRVML